MLFENYFHFSIEKTLTDKTNLIEMQRQFWQQAISAAGTTGIWCELKPDMKYAMKTSMKWPKIYKDRRRIVPADIHVLNEAKESERDVKFLVKNGIQ